MNSQSLRLNLIFRLRRFPRLYAGLRNLSQRTSHLIFAGDNAFQSRIHLPEVERALDF
jgi:hypothetical protein